MSRNGAYDSGFALVAVLIFFAVASGLLAPFFIAARTTLFLAHNHYVAEKDRLFLNGVGKLAVAQFIAKRLAGDRSANAFSKRKVVCLLNRETLTVSFQDHAGLIDLNASGRDLLAIGLRAVGIDEANAPFLAERILQSRSIKQSGQDETDDYLKHPESGLKHFRFEAVEELYDFRLLDKIDREKLTAVFTVHSRRGSISRQELPAPLLRTIDQLPPTSLPFVLNGQLPTQIITANLTLYNPSGKLTSATLTGQLTNNSSGTGIKILAPLVIDVSAAESDLGAPAPGAADCGLFFGEEIAASLREMRA